jgi:hypothetical protein
MSDKGTEARERNAALLERIKNGDETARHELILANDGLVGAKLKAHLNLFPHDAHEREDLFSAGTVGLIEAVNRIHTMRTGSVSSFLGRSITRAIRKYSLSAPMIREPVGSRWRNKANKKSFAPPECVSVSYSDGDGGVQVVDGAAPGSQELYDHILARCDTDEERAVITLLAAEMEMKAVAETLAIPYERVRYVREKVYERLTAEDDSLPTKPRRQPRVKVAKRLAA